MLEWKSSDPRLDVSKQADIVILRPLFGAGCAQVQTKHGWYIHTDFEDHKTIGADDEWDQDWRWILAP